MHVEQILTDELRSVAASFDAPPPPGAGLVRDAERAHTRTLRTRLAGTVLVAAAVVGAIVIGTQVGRPSTTPPPTNPSPSPSYYAPGVPYVLDGVLYVDHEPQPGSWAQAETVGEYLQKGRPALIEGRLQWRSWETEEGQRRSKHEVLAERVQFLSSPAGVRQEGRDTAAMPDPSPDTEDIPF